jgi:hypothetical protein
MPSNLRPDSGFLRTSSFLLFLVMLGACTTQGEANPPMNSGNSAEPEPVPLDEFGQPLPEPELLPDESNRDSTRRLLQLEHALDAWYGASERQEYARKESFELLLHDYTNQHFAAILGDLRGGNLRRGRVAAAALGFSDRKEAVRPLEKSLSSGEPQIIEHALLSLYHLGIRNIEGSASAKDFPRVDPRILAPFLSNAQPTIRSNAALAMRPNLGEGQTPSDVLLALISACADQDDRVRVHALAALGSTRDVEAIPHLVRGLSDPRPLGRMRAALGLGGIGDPQVAPYLVEVLRREKEVTEVKQVCARALGVLLNSNLQSTDATDWEPLLQGKSGARKR